MFKHNCPHKTDGVCIECYQHRITALEVEAARLRKDAARYRWLQTTNTYSYVWVNGVGLFGEKLDAAIDAAMKEQS